MLRRVQEKQMSSKVNPTWLESHWKQKRLQTAERVSKAIEELRRTGMVVTIAKICEAIQRIYGVSISANTITRNDLAYEIYKAHRAPPRVRTLKDPSLTELLKGVEGSERASLRTKIARLRRISKDGLISQLISLEAASRGHKVLECRLREEIVRLRLATSAGGGK
jgi:hypothetical protein